MALSLELKGEEQSWHKRKNHGNFSKETTFELPKHLRHRQFCIRTDINIKKERR